MNQAEGQQKSLVQSIESLPTRGSLSCLDQDLLLLKATSAATLSCLGECLTILQQSAGHNPGPPSGESNTDTLQTSMRPPDPEPAKDQGEVDCGPCPYLTGPVQLNVCNKCCWRAVRRSCCMFTVCVSSSVFWLFIWIVCSFGSVPDCIICIRAECVTC